MLRLLFLRTRRPVPEPDVVHVSRRRIEINNFPRRRHCPRIEPPPNFRVTVRKGKTAGAVVVIAGISLSPTLRNGTTGMASKDFELHKPPGRQPGGAKRKFARGANEISARTWQKAAVSQPSFEKKSSNQTENELRQNNNVRRSTKKRSQRHR